jgi:peptidoglycan/LPS O-acetylase OafA/YrhL
VFPFLLHFVERYGLKYVVGVLLVTLLFRCLHFFTYDRVAGIGYWTIVGRLDQFVIGMATAIVYRRLEAHKRALRWMFPGAVAVVLACLEWFNGEGGFPGDNWHRIFWPSIEGSFWAFLVLTYVSFDRGDGRTGNWVSAAVARLGQISFSTYLLHFPVIILLIHRRWVPHLATDPNDNGLLVTLLVAWPLSIAVSALTYNVVESPFMSYRKRYIQPERGTGSLPTQVS